MFPVDGAGRHWVFCPSLDWNRGWGPGPDHYGSGPGGRRRRQAHGCYRGLLPSQQHHQLRAALLFRGAGPGTVDGRGHCCRRPAAQVHAGSPGRAEAQGASRQPRGQPLRRAQGGPTLDAPAAVHPAEEEPASVPELDQRRPRRECGATAVRHVPLDQRHPRGSRPTPQPPPGVCGGPAPLLPGCCRCCSAAGGAGQASGCLPVQREKCGGHCGTASSIGWRGATSGRPAAEGGGGCWVLRPGPSGVVPLGPSARRWGSKSGHAAGFARGFGLRRAGIELGRPTGHVPAAEHPGRHPAPPGPGRSDRWVRHPAGPQATRPRRGEIHRKASIAGVVPALRRVRRRPLDRAFSDRRQAGGGGGELGWRQHG
mmetsp:Transcript_142851/g.319419  ORF Transcript_142851/g.319419 Transcript_142851/m.319419 type:complete len:369 (+) Transcript_142851:869-1975(+)